MNPPRPMPCSFAAAASRTNAELKVMYHCSSTQIKRWRDEIGLHVGRGRSGRSILQIDGNKIVKLHKTLRSAACEVDGNSSNICLCANGKIPTAYGYKWKYESEAR